MVLRRRAAKNPAAMASGIVRTSPKITSCADRPSAGNSRSATGCLNWYESPKSNVNAPLTSRPNCSGFGSLNPISSFTASTWDAGANGPRICGPGSTGGR